MTTPTIVGIVSCGKCNSAVRFRIKSTSSPTTFKQSMCWHCSAWITVHVNGAGISSVSWTRFTESGSISANNYNFNVEYNSNNDRKRRK